MWTILMLLSDASACGGFFCNNLVPIEQAREVLLFEVDPTLDRTTMHVQVDYEGPPNLFAWVVPVRGTPDLFLSTEQLFAQLDTATRPRFSLDRQEQGECLMPESGADMDSDGLPDVQDVDVLARERVGPYDTAIIHANTAGELISWLQQNRYAVPRDLTDVMAPYLADGHNFLALRLAADEDVGSLAPIGLQYDGQTPTIPLHLSQVAAIEDMPIVAYTLGPARAVPSNYLHVQINPAAVHWFNEGDNYDDLVARAADEAGGRAFATDYTDDASVFADHFYPSSLDTAQLDQASSATDFLFRLSAVELTPEVAKLLETVLHVPDGHDTLFVFRTRNVQLNAWNPEFDAAAAAIIIEERLLEPLREVQAGFDRSQTLTRLSSAISPSEMTVDPRFHFDPTLTQQVSHTHVATLIQRCEGASILGADRSLVLPDGTNIDLPSTDELNALGLDEQGWLDQLQEPAAIRIESFTPNSNGAELVFDGTVYVIDQIDDLNHRAAEIGSSSGCDHSGLSALWLGLLLPLLARRRA